MKIKCFFAGVSMLGATVLSSCGDSVGASSSSDCFGNIPGIIASYQKESEDLKADMTKDNYEKKGKQAKELTENTIAEVEKIAAELNGKEIACTVDEAQLKVIRPVTLIFESMNQYRPVFRFGGEVVAASDLTLNVNPSDLGTGVLFNNEEMSVTVRMPVALDFLDKDGNVIKHINDIGTLEAVNDGENAIVKAGTIVNFCRTFDVDNKLADVMSIYLTVELDKKPYTSRSLK